MTPDEELYYCNSKGEISGGGGKIGEHMKEIPESMELNHKSLKIILSIYTLKRINCKKHCGSDFSF